MAAKRKSILLFAVLALAMTMTSLTSFRFTGVPIGISELLVLLCLVLHLPLSFGIHVNNGPRYFAGIVLVLFFATLPGFVITLVNEGTVDYALYNLTALAYIVVLVTYIHYGFDYRAVKFENLIVFFTAFSILYFVILLAFFFLDPNLVYLQDDIESVEFSAGAATNSSQNYGEPTYRLVGFSENPNQLAMHAFVLVFFCLTLWHRLGFVMGIFGLSIALTIGVLTHSDAFLGSAIALLFVSIVMGIVFGKSVVLGLTILVPSVVGLVLVYQPALTYFRDIAQYKEQDETRYNLWLNGIEAGLHRPLTGMGPGIWSGENGPFEQIEAHNSAIDYFSMAGVPGTVVLVVAILYLLFYCIKSGRSTLLAGFLAIGFYASFHNVLRQPIIWLAIYTIAHGVWMQVGNHHIRRRIGSKRRRKRAHKSRGLDL